MTLCAWLLPVSDTKTIKLQGQPSLIPNFLFFPNLTKLIKSFHWAVRNSWFLFVCLFFISKICYELKLFLTIVITILLLRKINSGVGTKCSLCPLKWWAFCVPQPFTLGWKGLQVDPHFDFHTFFLTPSRFIPHVIILYHQLLLILCVTQWPPSSISPPFSIMLPAYSQSLF